MIKAVVFDLDDTLFPEREYVRSGFNAVSELLEKKYGISNAYEELHALFDESAKGVFDRFAARHSDKLTAEAASELVDCYRNHTPKLTLSDEVKSTLVSLREKGYKLGIITDGRPNGQRKKIDALGLNNLVDKIIITDELGERFRKPNPKAFELMAAYFGISLNEMLYLGDNPQKDFVIGKRGVTTVRLLNDGVYAECDYAEGVKESMAISKFVDLADAITG